MTRSHLVKIVGLLALAAILLSGVEPEPIRALATIVMAVVLAVEVLARLPIGPFLRAAQTLALPLGLWLLYSSSRHGLADLPNQIRTAGDLFFGAELFVAGLGSLLPDRHRSPLYICSAWIGGYFLLALAIWVQQQFLLLESFSFNLSILVFFGFISHLGRRKFGCESCPSQTLHQLQTRAQSMRSSWERPLFRLTLDAIPAINEGAEPNLQRHSS